MTYIIVKKTRGGTETHVHFEPDTLEACAGAMDAMTCGNRRNARHYLKRGQSYTASNASGDFLTARYVPSSREEAIRDAQARGVWPMPKRRNA